MVYIGEIWDPFVWLIRHIYDLTGLENLILTLVLGLPAGVMLGLSVPFVYDKYQDLIDDKLCETHRVIQMQCRKIDDTFLKKVPVPSMKEKKTE